MDNAGTDGSKRKKLGQECPTRFDVIVQGDALAGEGVLEHGELLADFRGDGMLDFLLDLSGGIFAGSDEASAGLAVDAVDDLAEEAFEFHDLGL